MRCSSLVLALLLIACSQSQDTKPGKAAAQADKAPTPAERELETDGEPSGVKTPGNLPVKTEAELDAEAVAQAQCVASCVEANVAVAKPADVIEADCRAKCEPGPAQVEVRP